MSSSELPKSGDNRAKDGSETDSDMTTLPSVPGSSNSQTIIQPTEQQSGISESKTKYESTTLKVPLSASKPSSSSMKENKLIYQTGEDIGNFDAFKSQTTLSSVYPDETPHCSKPFPHDNIEDSFIQPDSGTKEKTGIFSFREFSLCLNDLPFTKEKIDKSLCLTEACGLFTYLMKTKRGEFSIKEKDIEQVLVELQISLRDAKSICIKLENAPNTVPENMNEAIVQAQKLMYILSSSSLIFEKIDNSGLFLKELVGTYTKETGDFHASVDLLLEYIMESILQKCSEFENDS